MTMGKVFSLTLVRRHDVGSRRDGVDELVSELGRCFQELKW